VLAHEYGQQVSAKMRNGAAVDAATQETVSEWYARYYRWREGRVSGAESVEDSRGRFRKWIEPKLGTLAMVKVTRDNLEAFAEYLDEQAADEVIAPKTALNIFGELTVGFAFARYGKNKYGKNLALRILGVDPAEDAAGPDAGTDKQKPFLRPDEVMKLLACEAVPLERRHVYALAIYTAMRQGELRALQVRDVDLESMQITVVRQVKNGKEKDRTKTGRARIVQIEPHLVPLLEMLIAGKQPTDRVLWVGAHNRCASYLREDLLTAGCTRGALHVDKKDPMRARMKFHNLRDTCLTHMAVRRDPPQDVQWRAGHTTPAMTEAYIANARYQAGANFGAPLAPLPQQVLRALPPDGGGGFWSSFGISVEKGSKAPRKRWRRRELKPTLRWRNHCGI
jgi:integrase